MNIERTPFAEDVKTVLRQIDVILNIHEKLIETGLSGLNTVTIDTSKQIKDIIAKGEEFDEL